MSVDSWATKHKSSDSVMFYVLATFAKCVLRGVRGAIARGEKKAMEMFCG